MAGGLAPVLSPAYISPQLPPSSKSSRIQNQAVCSLVTLFVFPKSYCGSCCFPPFGIHTVTNFLNCNTLGTAEGHCLPRYLGGGRACPAYRLYPACVSSQLQLAFNGSFSFMTGYCGRSAPAAVLTMYVTSVPGFPLPQHCFMSFDWYVSLLSAPHRTQACHGLCRAEIRGYCVGFPVCPAWAVSFPYRGLKRKTPA